MTLAWTTTPPSEPGWYWHKWPFPKDDRYVEVLRVMLSMGRLVACLPDEDPSVVAIDEFRDDCLWCLIPVPVDGIPTTPGASRCGRTR